MIFFNLKFESARRLNMLFNFTFENARQNKNAREIKKCVLVWNLKMHVNLKNARQIKKRRTCFKKMTFENVCQIEKYVENAF